MSILNISVIHAIPKLQVIKDKIVFLKSQSSFSVKSSKLCALAMLYLIPHSLLFRY
jgi:hypothetical protein